MPCIILDLTSIYTDRPLLCPHNDSITQAVQLPCSGSKTFRVPSTGEELDRSGTMVFATMNPASIGGGRGALPRSIRNLFTTVRMDFPNDEELSLLVLSTFSPVVDDSSATAVLRRDHPARIFNLHKEVLAHVSRCGAAQQLCWQRFA